MDLTSLGFSRSRFKKVYCSNHDSNVIYLKRMIMFLYVFVKIKSYFTINWWLKTQLRAEFSRRKSANPLYSGREPYPERMETTSKQKSKNWWGKLYPSPLPGQPAIRWIVFRFHMSLKNGSISFQQKMPI